MGIYLAYLFSEYVYLAMEWENVCHVVFVNKALTYVFKKVGWMVFILRVAVQFPPIFFLPLP